MADKPATWPYYGCCDNGSWVFDCQDCMERRDPKFRTYSQEPSVGCGGCGRTLLPWAALCGKHGWSNYAVPPVEDLLSPKLF